MRSEDRKVEVLDRDGRWLGVGWGAAGNVGRVMRRSGGGQRPGAAAGSRRQAVGAVVAVSVMTLAMVLVLVLTSARAVQVRDRGELADFDYSSGVARVEASCFEWFPSRLLEPGDFALGDVGNPEPITRTSGQYGTYRLVVDLPAGEVYGLAAYSATYAQKLWVDGVLVSQVGVPGHDAASTVPKTSYYAVYFTATPGPTEFVIQRSEFVHAQGGQLYPQFLGTQEAITAMVDLGQLRGAVMAGFMLLAGLFLLGFFFVSGRSRFAWFALACLAIMVRTVFTDLKLIMVVFPDLGWQLSHRIEAWATLGFGVFVLLYLDQMSPRRQPRVITVAGLGFFTFGLGMSQLTPSTVYTRLIPTLQVVYLALFVAAFAALARSVWKDDARRTTEPWLALGGAAALAALTVSDVVRYRFTGQYDDLNLAQAGMGVFVFANMLALALGFFRSEWALAATRREVAELARREQRRRAFLADVGHEMRTPLTVMSAYAQYTRAQLEEGTADEDTRENLLTISREAQRLSTLVGTVLAETGQTAGGAGREPSGEREESRDRKDRQVLDVGELFAQVVALCQPILLERGNRLDAVVAPGCPPVLGCSDQIFQVLVNLCVNANRHMEGGVVRVDALARADADAVAISVEDHGDGVRPDLLPFIFERGVSGDGGAGLGLAICRDVVEAHGGEISAASAPGEGTRITFTLPAARPDEGAAPIPPVRQEASA
jgi:signal transduction histidine kinase